MLSENPFFHVYLARKVDISIAHFSHLVRALRGLNFEEAVKLLEGVIARGISLHRLQVKGKRVFGNHSAPQYPVKAARAIHEILKMLFTRLASATPKLSMKRVLFVSLNSSIASYRKLPLRRARGAMDFTRRIRYDLTLRALVLDHE